MAWRRQRSALFAPASASFRIPMICSSVNRLRFIAGLPAGILAEPTLIRGGPVFGEQVARITARAFYCPRRSAMPADGDMSYASPGEAHDETCQRRARVVSPPARDPQLHRR